MRTRKLGRTGIDTPTGETSGLRYPEPMIAALNG